MKKLACCLFFVSSVCVAGSQNLWQVFQLAQQNAPSNKANQMTQFSSVNNYRSAAAGLFPQVSGTADYITGHYGSGAVRGAYRAHVYTLEASQQIFNPMLWTSVASSYNTAQGAVATYQYQYQQFIQSVIKSYFAVLESQDLLDVAKAKELYLYEVFNQAKAQFKVGVATVTSAKQAEASYLEAHADRLAAENAVHDAKLDLQTLTNVPVSKLAPLVSENINLPSQMDASHWVQLALAHNENLRAFHYQTQSAKDSLDNREAQWWPTVDVVGKVIKPDSNASDAVAAGIGIGQTIIRSVELDLNWNIFTGPNGITDGANISSVREGANLYASSQFNELQTRRNVTSAIHQDVANVKTDVTRIHQYEAAVKAGSAATQQYAAKFKVGATTMADYLKQVSLLYKDKSNLFEARYQFINDKVQLYLDAGVLSVKEIRFLNNQLG